MAILSAMKITDWIRSENLSMAEVARRLGVEGVNPSRTLSRIASGERQPDAVMIERIRLLTADAVGAADMHETRLAWLRTNCPERFASAAGTAVSP